MSPTNNLPLTPNRFVTVVDISEDNNDTSETNIKTSKRSFNQVQINDNVYESKNKKARTHEDIGNQAILNESIEVIDISDDEFDNENLIHQNDKNLKTQLMEKEKQLEKIREERIQQDKYIQTLLTALQNSKTLSQLEQPKVIETQKEQKQLLNLW
jgi:hypothetical protein